MGRFTMAARCFWESGIKNGYSGFFKTGCKKQAPPPWFVNLYIYIVPFAISVKRNINTMRVHYCTRLLCNSNKNGVKHRIHNIVRIVLVHYAQYACVLLHLRTRYVYYAHYAYVLMHIVCVH